MDRLNYSMSAAVGNKLAGEAAYGAHPNCSKCPIFCKAILAIKKCICFCSAECNQYTIYLMHTIQAFIELFLSLEPIN